MGRCSMASSGANQGDIFDVKRIRRLVELMNEHELSEIDLRQADQRIRLRKGGEPVVTMVPAQGSSGGQAASASPSEPGAQPPAKADEQHIAVIKSPMVGTF